MRLISHISHPHLPLLLCASFGLGEFLASPFPWCAHSWPAFALIALLVCLFGFGLKIRGWCYLASLLLGAAIFLHASLPSQLAYLQKPWLRGKSAAKGQFKRMTPKPWVKDCQQFLSHRLSIGLPKNHPSLSLARAILLGDRTSLSPSTKLLFINSGTIHLFAISGLHVFIIAQLLSSLLSATLLPRRFAPLASLPLLWLYAAIINFPPSAVRAVLMTSLAFLAPLLWRKPHALSAWCLTFLIVHSLNPLLISHVGNILSFLVMLAILLVSDAAANLPRWKQSLLVSLAAWLVSVPISIHVFGRLTPIGLLANLLLISIAKYAVISGVLAILLSMISFPLAAYFNNFAALTIQIMTSLAQSLSLIPLGNFQLQPCSLALCMLFYAALIFLFVAFSRARAKSGMSV